MPDKKLSEFAVASTLTPTDQFILVGDKRATSVVAFGNQPLVGNTGISKDVVEIPSIPGAISLLKTLVNLTSAGTYTLGAGTAGQKIEILSSAAAVVNLTGKGFTSISLPMNSTVSLRFVSAGWFITGSYNATPT